VSQQPSPVDAATRVRFGGAALDACRTVLHRVTADDLERPTPCTEFTVSGVGDHLARSMVLLAGCAGTQLFDTAAPTLLGRITPLAEGTLAAWRDRGFAGEVPLGRRTLPAGDIHDIVLLELVVHGWDLARALEADDVFDPSADLVAHLRQQAPVLIVPESRGRAFANAVDVGDAEEVPALSRLVAFTGRRP